MKSNFDIEKQHTQINVQLKKQGVIYSKNNHSLKNLKNDNVQFISHLFICRGSCITAFDFLIVTGQKKNKKFY